jgi:hypothetical protein
MGAGRATPNFPQWFRVDNPAQPRPKRRGPAPTHLVGQGHPVPPPLPALGPGELLGKRVRGPRSGALHRERRA